MELAFRPFPQMLTNKPQSYRHYRLGLLKSFLNLFELTMISGDDLRVLEIGTGNLDSPPRMDEAGSSRAPFLQAIQTHPTSKPHVSIVWSGHRVS